MKIGFIGLGKLGMPVAVCMSMKGHDVLGFDIDPKRMSKSNYPFEEVGTKDGETFQDMLKNSNIKFTEDLQQLIDHAELIFVAIQTPHSYEFEGVTRFKNTQDFDYTYLIKCLQSLCDKVKTNKVVSIISTVAPGTYASSLTNVLKTNTYVNYCYNPFFIAMGTVVPDFLNPEFVLIGTENPTAGEVLKEFYSTIHNKPVRVMSTASAEITKMAYNTMIGLKICFANNAMELCNIFGGNVDDVTDALKGATDRLISTKYLTAGMGDGGGCHPRDNIVLSYLAAKHNMSCDIAGDMMKIREHQTEWLVNLMIETNLPKVVLGRSFKPETNIETGSPSVLCINILKEKGFTVKSYEPFNDKEVPEFVEPSVFLIGTKHKVFQSFKFPRGSVVIDPHRYIEPQDGVKIMSLGKP